MDVENTKKGTGEVLLKVYDYCKELDTFYAQKNYNEIFKRESEIIKNVIKVDNIVGTIVDQNDKNIYSYINKPVNSHIKRELLNAFHVDNFYKSVLINGSYTLVMPCLDDQNLIGYYGFVRNDKDWDHESIVYLKMLIQLFMMFYSWEILEKNTGKYYFDQRNVIEKANREITNYLHSFDVSELKKSLRTGEYDELTQILNRNAGKETLEKLLKNAKNKCKDVIVCLIDINHLKKINETYGYSVGDSLIIKIVDMIKQGLRDSDVLFRLSGDVFVVGFYDYDKRNVKSLMIEILHKLKALTLEQKSSFLYSFCFGMSLVTPNSELSVNEIIDAADAAMYVQKRKFHLKENLELYKTTPSVQETFDYNKDLLYEALVKSTDDYLFICNLKTNVFKYTPEFVKEFNFPGEILSNAAAIFAPKIHKDDKYDFLTGNQLITDGRSDAHIIEYRALNKNNEWVWLRCRGNVAYDENGDPSIFAGFITNLGKKNFRDPLTGLYNKFEFEKRINQTVGQFTIVILNINGFNRVNQLFNHDHGDHVLRIIGQLLQSVLHRETTVFKLDGDEYGFIIKETDSTLIHQLFQKIQNFVHNYQSDESQSINLSFTGGAAIAPTDGNNYLELYKCCNTALKYGKSNNRNHLTFFSPALFEEERYSLRLLTTLQNDITKNYSNFHLVYQPKVAPITNKLVGFESLCRWRHKDYPRIGPGTFIPLLESSNDILSLGRWIFDESLNQLKQWLPLFPHLTMSINISYLQLAENDFVSFIKSCADYHEIPYENIIIELTETAITKNIKLTFDTIKEIRKLGIKIAMDDFGKGYSSLALLKDEPLDIIKVDQCFIRNIHKNSFNYAITKFIIDLCKQINLKVVVEGVETEDELKIINHLKPNNIQGYYTGKPMEASQCLSLIIQNIER